MEDLSQDVDGQRQAAFQLVADAAQRADNVGDDEFPLEWFDLMLQYSDIAVLLYDPPRDNPASAQRLLGKMTSLT